MCILLKIEVGPGTPHRHTAQTPCVACAIPCMANYINNNLRVLRNLKYTYLRCAMPQLHWIPSYLIP